jgi:hypothetical protein
MTGKVGQAVPFGHADFAQCQADVVHRLDAFNPIGRDSGSTGLHGLSGLSAARLRFFHSFE